MILSLRCLFLSLTLIGTISCTSQPTQTGTNIVGPVRDRDYSPVLKKFTREKLAYSGFHNTYQATLTLMTSEVQAFAQQRRGHFLQWDLETARSEREKMFQEMSSQTTVFLAFYSPESDYDDLHKAKSIWKIYFEYEGNRYEGRVKKASEKFVELRELYPYLEKFHTPYYVQFDIPTTAIEDKAVKITLTSSLGTGEFEF
jgi:hypothetical protein